MTTGVFGASDWRRWSSVITIVWPRGFRHSRGILTTDACCEEDFRFAWGRQMLSDDTVHFALSVWCEALKAEADLKGRVGALVDEIHWALRDLEPTR